MPNLPAFPHVQAPAALPMKVAIVGAGLVGRLLAWRLARRGFKVQIFDKGTPNQCLGAAPIAAGMIAPWSESVQATPEVIALGMQSLSLWPAWLLELEQDCGQTTDYFTQGTMVVAHPLDREDWHHFVSVVNQRHPEAPGQIYMQADLSRLVPELDHFEQGFFLENECVIDNRGLLTHLAIALQRYCVLWQQQTSMSVRDMIDLKDHFDRVIDCRGLGAKDRVSQLRGVRGEVIRVYAPSVHLQQSVRLIHPRYQLYIAPRRDHEYVIGATSIESESMMPISVRSTLELLSSLNTVSAHFLEATVLETASQCRPTLPDHNPLIKNDVRHQHLWTVNGLYRHGYMISPAFVDQAIEQIFINCEMPHATYH